MKLSWQRPMKLASASVNGPFWWGPSLEFKVSIDRLAHADHLRGKRHLWLPPGPNPFVFPAAVAISVVLLVQDSPQPQPGPAGSSHSRGVRAAGSPSGGPYRAAGTPPGGACESAAYRAPVINRENSREKTISAQDASGRPSSSCSVSSLGTDR